MPEFLNNTGIDWKKLLWKQKWKNEIKKIKIKRGM
jgi:hypothetical protein